MERGAPIVANGTDGRFLIYPADREPSHRLNVARLVSPEPPAGHQTYRLAPTVTVGVRSQSLSGAGVKLGG